jgi:hypothetical protein
MEMERELNRIHRKSMEARHAVESGKDTYLAAERAKILQEMLPTHFEERLRLCSEESEIPEQLKRYAELVSEYRTVENRYGDVAAKILSTVVDVRHIESDVIPELEQKMSGERRTESHKMLFRPDALTKI